MNSRTPNNDNGPMSISSSGVLDDTFSVFDKRNMRRIIGGFILFCGGAVIGALLANEVMLDRGIDTSPKQSTRLGCQTDTCCYSICEYEFYTDARTGNLGMGRPVSAETWCFKKDGNDNE